MRHSTCKGCENVFPMNDTVKIRGRILCHDCAELFLKKLDPTGRKVRPEKVVKHLVDPTICVMCGHDAGEEELGEVAGMPTCDVCATKLRKRPFPVWLKVAFVLAIIGTALMIARNYRFMKAYYLEARGMQSEDLAATVKYLEEAVELVPESEHLKILLKYNKGLYFMVEEGNYTAGIKCLESIKPLLSGDDLSIVNGLIKEAQPSAAFERGDYARFLELNEKEVKENPEDAYAHAGLASAYACLYAVEGKADYKYKALYELKKANQHATAEEKESLEEYKMRIMYRLDKREILSTKQFYEKCPDGYKHENKPGAAKDAEEGRDR